MSRSCLWLTMILAALAGPARAHAQCQTDLLTPAAPHRFAMFGRAVALSGNRMVVGAPDTIENNVQKGAAYVFDFTASGWTQTATLTVPSGAAFDDFGIAVAISGNTILVGADAVDGPLSGAVGAVYAFDWTGSAWSLSQKFQASDGASGGFFGGAVAMAGSTAIVGRWWDDAAAPHAGSAYVFKKTGSTWVESQKLLPTSAVVEANFGWSVAISALAGGGERIVVGAPERFSSDNSDEQRGRVFVYDSSGGLFSNTAVLTASNSMPFDQLGISVDVDQDRIAAGAWQATFFTPTAGKGEAFVFARTGSTWTEQQILTASDGKIEDAYGSAVAIEGTSLLVGADTRDAFPLTGGVYAYAEGGSGWTQTGLFLPTPSSAAAFMGASLAIDGNHAVSGALTDTGSAYQSGRAYVLGGFKPWTNEGFALAGSTGLPSLAGIGTLCPGTSTDLQLTGARASSTAILVTGLSRADLAFRGGTMVPKRDIVTKGLQTDGAGSLLRTGVLPAGLARGATVWYQLWIRDAAGVQGVAASNAVSAVVP